MRSKSILLLTLALGCGLIASIGISQVMERRNAQNAPAGTTAPIFVAAGDIDSRTLLTPEMVKLEEWPVNKIPAGAITKLEELADKRTRTKLYATEPILAAKLLGPNDFDGASNKIPKGYRVVPVRVDAVSGGSSLILPGDRVDVLVYLSRNPSTGIAETTTKTILQGVKVFAVDTTLEGKGDHEDSVIAAKTIALLVTLKQAQKITLATEMGSIRLVMRSPDDDQEAESETTRLEDILGTTNKFAHKADEEHERPKGSPADGGAAKSFVDWLNSKKGTGPALPLGAAGANNWKMVLLEGSDMREIEVSPDGKVLDNSARHSDPQAPQALPSPAGAPLKTTSTKPRHEGNESAMSVPSGEATVTE